MYIQKLIPVLLFLSIRFVHIKLDLPGDCSDLDQIPKPRLYKKQRVVAHIISLACILFFQHFPLEYCLAIVKKKLPLSHTSISFRMEWKTVTVFEISK